MKRHPGNRSGVRPSSKPEDAKPPTPEQLIQKELANLRARAEAVASSAHALTDLILEYKTSLVSDISIVRDTAALLQHSAQNFEQILAGCSKRGLTKRAGPRKETNA